MISLTDLEAKAKAATPGPWTLKTGHKYWRVIDALGNCIHHPYTAYPMGRNDSELIAAASPAVVLKLIEVIRCYEEALTRASRVLDGIKSECEASVYTCTDDEFGKTFYIRDACDLALAHARKVLET